MKIAKIFATGISGDIRSEFTVYNVKDVKTIKLTDQCKCYQFLGCEKGKAQAIYLHKTSDVFFRLIPDIEDIITIIEQEYSELSKAYQEKEKIYSSNPSIENKFEVEKNVELGCDLKGYVVLLKVTLYLIRLSAAVQAAELQIDTAGSI